MQRTEKILCILFCSYAFYLVSIADTQPEKVNDEARLFDDLFVHTRYDNSVRPVRNKASSVQVYLDVALVQLVDLDDADQSMTSNIWIRLTWMNEILRWNPADYGNVTRLTVNKQYPWKPDIVLYNNAENGEHGGNVGEFLTRIDVKYTGMNTWYIPAILKTSCGTDMTYFPFDSQVCPLTFGSWTYFRQHINITNIRDTMDVAPYLSSSSFYLRKTKATRNEVFYPCCADPIVTITYDVFLDRQPGFYFYNVVLPTLVITLMAFITFMLPDTIGERVGLTFDCFLANTFTSMMIKDMMPVSSDTMPVITKFMLMCMTLLLLSLLSNSYSLRCPTKRRMPSVIRIIFLEFLGPLLYVTKRSCTVIVDENENDSAEEIRRYDPLASKSRYGKTLTVSNQNEENYEMLRFSQASFSQSTGYPETSESGFHGDSHYDYQHKKRYFSAKGREIFHEQPFSSGFHSLESQQGNKPTKQETDCLKNLKKLVDEYDNQISDQNHKEFWSFVSKIVDRLFLLGFVLAWISMSLALFLQIPFHKGVAVKK